MNIQPQSKQFLTLDLLCSEDTTTTVVAELSTLPEEEFTDQQRQCLSAEASQWLKQGLAHFRQGQYPSALSVLRQSLQSYHSLGDKHREGKVLLVLASLYYRVADYLWAADYGRQCLKVAREIDDQPLMQQVLGHLGNSYRHLGDLQNALGYMNQSLQLAKHLGDRNGEMRSLNNLAMIYRAKGLARQAATLYEASLLMADALSDNLVRLQVLQNLGNTYQSLQEFSRAIQCYELFLELNQKRNVGAVDNYVIRRTLTHLTSASLAIQDYPRAIVHLRHHLSLARSFGDSRAEDALFKELNHCYNAFHRQNTVHKQVSSDSTND